MATPFSDRPSFSGVTIDLFDYATARDLPPDTAAMVREIAKSIPIDTPQDGTDWARYARAARDTIYTLSHGTQAEFELLINTLFATPLPHGFAQDALVYGSLKNDAGGWHHVGTIALDRLYRLAEAVGATRVQSREHGQTSIAVAELDGVFASIERQIGVDLTPPSQAGALFGIKLQKGVFSERHFDGIYGAWRLREFARSRGLRDPAVVEIGGGAGYLAYYANRMGLTRYTIVDLPIAGPVQFVLLADAFGTAHVTLGPGCQPGIHLVRAGSPAATDFSGFDLAVNVDSLPEMRADTAQTYLDAIRPGQILLSINQESAYQGSGIAQNVVADLARARGLRRLTRSPAWLRTGYVEEIFEA